MFVISQLQEEWVTAKYIHDAFSINSKAFDRGSMLSQILKTDIVILR